MLVPKTQPRSLTQEARSIIQSLEERIQDSQHIFHLTGLRPSIALEERDCPQEALTATISRLYLRQVLEDSPCLSEASRARLRLQYHSVNLVDHEEHVDALSDAVMAARHCERLALSMWLEDQGLAEGSQLSCQLSSAVNGQKDLDYQQVVDHFEILSLLEAFLADMAREQLAGKPMAEIMAEGWLKEGCCFGRGAYRCRYFSLHTNPAGEDQLVFTEEAKAPLRALISSSSEVCHERD